MSEHDKRNCPHTTTEWYREEWAVAHGTGFEVKVCSDCQEILERRLIRGGENAKHI